MPERSQFTWMRGLIVVFVVISAAIALVQYTSTITFIAQLMSISWGALAGAFLGPLIWGLYSSRISKGAVWASFFVGVGRTVSNMFIGFIASPINCGALAMILSLVVVPLVSLVTPSVPFQVKMPTGEGAIDREIERELREEAAAARSECLRCFGPLRLFVVLRCSKLIRPQWTTVAGRALAGRMSPAAPVRLQREVATL